MKKLMLGTPTGAGDVGWAHRALKTIERASFEDIETLFDDLTISGTYTDTRTLDADTATLADLIAFVATLISDIQKRGQNRDGG